MAAKSKKEQHNHGHSTTIARLDDGTVQMTFTIPQDLLKSEMDQTALKLGETTTVPGFRKGKAPLSSLISHISKDKLTEKTLQQLLPHIFGHAVDEHKLKPITYPKFELLKTDEGEDWEIRAITAEFPKIDLGNYKELVKGELAASAIWTPEKGDAKKPKELTREEKEQKVLTMLVEKINVVIPQMLLQDEVEHRLSQLLARLEKLGISLETYLASIKKTPVQMREEYEAEAKHTLKLEFILAKISQDEKMTVEQKEFDEFVAQSGMTPTEEQHQFITSILLKRKAIDSLVNLV